LVAVNFDTGEKYLIDVKSTHYKKASPEMAVEDTFTIPKLSPDQTSAGIRALCVLPDGQCFWGL
jgi:hypothetical protein